MQGVAAIAGEREPRIGRRVVFRVTDWYAGTPERLRNPALVTWELFKQAPDGRFLSTGLKKKGVGEFTFGQKALGHRYAVEGYLFRPEGKPRTRLMLWPQPAEPRIIKLELLDNAGKRIEKPLKYGQSIVAKAHCANMEGGKLLMRLWEDDAPGAGHNPENERNAAGAFTVIVRRGIAACRFVLTPDLVRMANAHRDGAGDKLHEYYVTATYLDKRGTRNTSSRNAEADNPTYEPEGPSRNPEPPVSKLPPVPSRPLPIPPAPMPVPLPAPAPIPLPKGEAPEDEMPAPEGPTDRIPTVPSKPLPVEPPAMPEAEARVQIKVEPTIGVDPPAKGDGESPVIVDPGEKGEEKKKCLCEEYNLLWGGHPNVDCAFRRKVIEVSKRLGVEASHLMVSIAHETAQKFDSTSGTFKKHKDEKKEGYVGLIQIGKDAAQGIGITRTQLLAMDRLEQLDYVEKYLRPFRGKLITLVDFYLSILFPVDCGRGNQPDHIVFDSSLPIRRNAKGIIIKDLNYWRNVAYSANPSFHKEKLENGKTYVWEIAENIILYETLGRKYLCTQRDYTCSDFHQNEEEPIDPSECSAMKCMNYSDPLPSPRLNDQSNNVNKNRFKRARRYNQSHPKGYFHTGVDILAKAGTPIRPILCGTVFSINDSFKPNEYRSNSLGNTIVIESHDKMGEPVYFKYCHLYKILVKKGDYVSHQTDIALAGSTGNAASVFKDGKLTKGILPRYRHIHIEASTYSSFGDARIDPEIYMKTKFDETPKGTPI